MILAGLWFLAYASATHATVLFSSDFESGSLSSSTWYNPGAYVVASNPDSTTTNSSAHVLSSAGGNTRSTNLFTLASAVTPSSGQTLKLEYKFDASAAGDSWWTNSLYLMGGPDSASTLPAYMFSFGGSSQSVQLLRLDQGFYSAGANKVTLTSLSLTAGITNATWNSVTFTWAVDGTFTLALNGTTILSWTDTTYTPSVQAIALSTFLNNNATAGGSPSGRVLYLDDITLSSVPEPSVACLGILGVVLIGAYRQSSPRRWVA